MLLFRYGKALRVSEESGSEILAEAETALRATGNLETAAEAAVLQGELAWFAGDGERATHHLARAADLVDGLPPSASKAFVLSDLSRFNMLAGRNELAIAIGREALEIADALGLHEVRAHALNNIGCARFFMGEKDGLADLESALEIATAINSPEAARVMNNLAGSMDELGDTKRAWRLWRDGLAVARELGNVPVARFISGAIPMIDYADGAWDEALRQLDEFIADAEAGGGHAQEPASRVFRGQIRFGREDVAGALEDAERGLAAARRIGDPQSMVPALSYMTVLLVELRRESEANESLDELLEYAGPGGRNFGPDLAVAMIKLGRNEVGRLSDATPVGPWRDLFGLIAAGNLPQAAAVCEEIGLRPGTALLRLRAAEQLIAEGRSDEAREHVTKALEFWRSVGAAHFIREAETLAARLDAAKPRRERTASR
jgi:tetratricopeptide (TPR) repeat protein